MIDDCGVSKSIDISTATKHPQDALLLAARYEEVWGKPPRSKNRHYLWKRIAWKLQEQRYGGLSKVAQSRLEELIAEIDIPIEERARSVSGAPTRPRVAIDPVPGTTLVRMYRSAEVRVKVFEDGFEWEGRQYRSLSAVAKEVTGSHLNGVRFFHLDRKETKK